MRVYAPFGLVFAAAIVGMSHPGDASETRLRIVVTPRVATAPATLRVRAIVEPRAENRALRIVVDSGDYYRSSVVPLDGADAAAVTETTLKNLPGGHYDVSVTLVHTTGEPIVERREVIISSVRDES